MTERLPEIFTKQAETDAVDAHAQLETYCRFYNERRPYSAPEGGTPGEAYRATEPKAVNQ